MNYYIEINLLDNKKYSIYNLWSKLYIQLHLVLAEHQKKELKTQIGFSFPEYYYDNKYNIGILGSKIRVFSNDKNELISLNLEYRLNSLKSYLFVSVIEDVLPNQITGYAIYKRKQFKTNIEKLARRKSKIKNISYEQALNDFKNYIPPKIGLPYIQLKSLHSNSNFNLYIEKIMPINKYHGDGNFNTYGLSENTILPEF